MLYRERIRVEQHLRASEFICRMIVEFACFQAESPAYPLIQNTRIHFMRMPAKRGIYGIFFTYIQETHIIRARHNIRVKITPCVTRETTEIPVLRYRAARLVQRKLPRGIRRIFIPGKPVFARGNVETQRRINGTAV